MECNICMDLVMQKDKPSERKFGLLDCEHAFCLGCIRSWRSNTEGEADVSTVPSFCLASVSLTQHQISYFVLPYLVKVVPEKSDLLLACLPTPAF